MITLMELTFDDMFEDVSTGKIYIVKNFEGSMVEVREAGTKRYWAFPFHVKVKKVNHAG
jgi:hypothetical protein